MCLCALRNAPRNIAKSHSGRCRLLMENFIKWVLLKMRDCNKILRLFKIFLIYFRPSSSGMAVKCVVNNRIFFYFRYQERTRHKNPPRMRSTAEKSWRKEKMKEWNREIKSKVDINCGFSIDSFTVLSSMSAPSVSDISQKWTKVFFGVSLSNRWDKDF